MSGTAWPDAVFPYARRTFDVGGHELAYVDEGAGPVVVCVHGNPTWSFGFRALIAGLRDTHRVIAPDHIGMGRSSRPAPGAYPFTLERRTQDLTALLDHLVPDDPVHLVAHDWGGPIGLGWATRHPDRVGRLLLLNTVGFPLAPGRPLPWQLRFARTPPGRVLIRLGGFSVATLLVGARQPLGRDAVRGYLAPHGSWREREAVLRFVEDIPTGPADPSWEALVATEAGLAQLADHPTVIAWGLGDPVFTPDLLAVWRRRLPDARIEALPDAGHLVTEDAPDRVLELARELFAEPGPDRPGRGGADAGLGEVGR